jgi:hypothetical protein
MQGCGSGSGLDPDSVTLWIGSVLGIRIPDPDPGARKLRNFSGKIHFLVIKKNFTTKKVYLPVLFEKNPVPYWESGSRIRIQGQES